MMYICQ